MLIIIVRPNIFNVTKLFIIVIKTDFKFEDKNSKLIGNKEESCLLDIMNEKMNKMGVKRSGS